MGHGMPDWLSLEMLDSYVQQLGSAAPPLYALLLVISGFVPLPGFGVLILAAGFIFGFPLGVAIVYPSAVVGSCMAFSVGKLMPGWLMRRLPVMLLDLQDVIVEGGFTILLLLRLTPLPFAFSNLFLGSIPGIPFTRYASATALGFLRLSANVFCGSQMAKLAEGEGSWVERAIAITGAMAFMTVTGTLGKTMLKRTAAKYKNEKKKE